jgi:ABC-2 type transport system permease protein
MTAVASAPASRSPLPVLRRQIIDGWRGVVGWSIGIAGVLLIYLPVFPSMQTPELSGMLDSLPPELVRTLGYENITTGAGYAQSTFFGLIGFVFITIAGISWGSASTAGAEESGQLELILAHDVGRVRYALESAAALTLKLIVLGAAGYLVVWLMNDPAGLGLDAGNLLAVSKAWVGLGLLAATAAFAAGAATGRRTWAIGAGAALAVVGYVLQAVANNSEDLDWLRTLSPIEWAYGNAPLASGFDWAGLALLWGGSAVLIGLATLALTRRDILG